MAEILSRFSYSFVKYQHPPVFYFVVLHLVFAEATKYPRGNEITFEMLILYPRKTIRYMVV